MYHLIGGKVERMSPLLRTQSCGSSKTPRYSIGANHVGKEFEVFLRYGAQAGDRRLLPTTVAERIEVRRLMAWFNDKFFQEASGPLVNERVYKRFMMPAQGGGAPSTDVLRAAKANVRYHLAYVGWLARTRNFLAGDRLTYADLAAAAHLSTADYLGDVPWNEDEAAKAWYARIKSRPSFRPLLNEWLAGVPASAHYVDLDF